MDSHVRCRRRAGATIVEAAFILPVFFAFVYGIVAYGHAQMVNNMLRGATRTAARYGANEGITSAQVQAKVKQIMAAGVNPSFVNVSVKDAGAYDKGSAFPTTGPAVGALPDLEIKNAETRHLFIVRASIDYNNAAILPVWWLKGAQLSAQAYMRHE